MVGLIIGKQGANKKALSEKYGAKIFVEDGTDTAIIHLSGKDTTVLAQLQQEMTLLEKTYDVPDSKIPYLVGPKF